MTSQPKYKVAASPKTVIARFATEEEIAAWVESNCTWRRSIADSTRQDAEFQGREIGIYERQDLMSGDGESVYGAWVKSWGLTTKYMSRKVAQ